MRIRKAFLIKKSTDDGLFHMKDNIELGTEYSVDIDSIQSAEFYNIPTQRKFESIVIYDVKAKNFLPVEIFEIEGLD